MAINKFATKVLADGPIGYWRLGETIASVTADDTWATESTGATAALPRLRAND